MNENLNSSALQNSLNESVIPTQIGIIQRTINMIVGERREAKYVAFGDDNLYPQSILDLVNNSTDDRAMWLKYTMAAFGEGFSSPYFDSLDPGTPNLFTRSNLKYRQTLNELLFQTIADVVLGETATTKTVVNEDGELTSLFNVDWGDARLALNKSRDNIGFITSNDWSIKDPATSFFRKFNLDTIVQDRAQIYQKTLPKMGRKYYNLSRIHANRHNIDTHTQQELLMNDLFDDGAFVQTVITTYEQGDPVKIAKNHKKLMESISGGQGRKIITQNARNRDLKPDWDIILPDISKVFDVDQVQMLQQKKALAWRIPSSLVYKTAGSGFQREDTIEAMSFWMNQEIKPIQNFVTDFYNGIFAEFGIDADLSITNADPFTPITAAEGVEEPTQVAQTPE